MSKHETNLTPMIGNLADGLTTASQSAWQAFDAAKAGRTNEAIGTLLPVMDQLETHAALCKTILALHRIGKGGTR
ncbi:hypothetical protein [Filomicrobium sp.]|uniref:hypothetical protein n=1 Tax=Filomicrobium sp. TaxID=2024831 RepID=UPI002584AAB4|nr:hypothetical protein [Filomicrobium sp.]MCV0370220.1 hypothetical protein [Filomicrobium sp.]